MKTVAQHYQPSRLIAVGNRQHCRSSQHIAAPRYIVHCTSTFPSLVGSVVSRLEVGNRHSRNTAPHNTGQCNNSRGNSSQRLPNPAATAFVRLLVGLSATAHRVATPHATFRRLASQRITLPSVVGLRAECGGYLPAISNRISALGCTLRLISSQRIPAKRRPPSGGVRFAGTTRHHHTALRAVLRFVATHLNAPNHHMRRQYGLRIHS